MATLRLGSPANRASDGTRLSDLEFPGYVAGRFYTCYGDFPAAPTTGSPQANTSRFIPWIVRGRCTISTLAARISTAYSGGNIQLAVYAADPATKFPTGAPIATTASQSTTNTGTYSLALSANVVITGTTLLWIAVNADNSSTAFPAGVANNAAYMQTIGSTTATNALAGALIQYLQVSQTFGSWPTLSSSTTFNEAPYGPHVFAFQVASVP